MAQTILTAGGASDNSSLESGNDGTLVLKVGPSGGKVNALSFALDGTPTFTKPIVSPTSVVTQANQTPLPGGGTVLSFSHGLGAVPVSAELELVCLVAELGYSVGDVASSVYMQPSGTNYAPICIRKNATVVSAVTGFSAAFVITNAATSAVVAPTPANWAWRFKVRAT